MEQIRLRVAGKPASKQRPRVNRKQGRMYNPTANVTAENEIRAVWRETGEPRFEGRVPLRLYVWVFLQRPRSHYRVDGTLSREGERHLFPVRKPDLDNTIKLYADALNGLAYEDDSQIVDLRAKRLWAHEAKTVLTLELLESL